ncbi:hypothetical protein ABT159_28840 [Streptomyces sp. NPDC001642]
MPCTTFFDDVDGVDAEPDDEEVAVGLGVVTVAGVLAELVVVPMDGS